MAKFHINPSTGDVSVCRSLQGKCPFGEAAHADTQEGARALYEKTMSVETVAVLKKTPSNGGVKGAVASGAQGIMGAYGSKSYAETIANARERAGYASSYYDRKAEKGKATSRVLRGNSTLASAAVSDRTRGALSSAPASADFSRAKFYTSPAVDNIEAVRSALSSKDSSAVTSPIGAAAGNFTW